jgi:NADPH-dependent curcumin reductase CurA
MRTIMSKGLEVRGFGGTLVGGTAALEQMTDWVKTRRIRYPEVIVDGLESAPAAFAGIFRSNSNVGKLLVRVSTV